MSSDRVTRRLVAILAIDMVGYSRHVGADEAGTIARQRAHRRDLIDPVLQAYGGRIVKTTGDGLLVEFGSVVDALDSAVRIQRAVLEAEAGLPAERRIQYRAGINLGDIVIDGDDILGDGVNIAARLEGMAEPGGISITASVFDQVIGKLDLAFDDLGQQQLKNIRKPVRVYRVRLEAADDAGSGASGGAAAAAKPSIAVLPFQDMSADRDQEYFADGIAEDIITGLSKHNGFLVIARNSSFTYKGRPVDVKQVAAELGVRYVLEGSVRKGGSRVRITGQLIDAATGAHVWAERYDREIHDLFAVQDEITDSIVGVVAPELIGAEMQRARRQDPASMDAWDCVMRAGWHAWRLTAADGAQARTFAAQAIALDPGIARARVVHAMCDVWDVLFGRSADPARSLGDADAMARQAVDLDPRDAEAQTVLGMVALFLRRFDESQRRLETALALNPNLAFAHMLGGGYYALAGDSETARHTLQTALRLSPRDPANHWVHAFLGLAAFAAGDDDGAAEWARQAIHLYPAFPVAHRLLAASLSALGQADKAKAALAGLLAVAPGATIANTRAGVPWKQPEVMERYLDTLRRAGLPD
ncbi:TolB-like protein/class 3 adenylate cyclase/Flp pilus assembly protein TadD [Inquilinus ginsengisoli]|uniref:TolB-like protein/class 3 adenylate cyclase/Flp pilus assembly protein TadD n=1 Tax=Inquilinus ginsengisoli TaxID=363840 RepID=A0ABU1JZK7_9PROT|nr:adenylate/guanylate cyclase domain-containing protein [Inquilinus ginsengisoli]MDR6293459.1 TolB-like protein/class 3 adenylate cyclase/Flp pilus assembly protein TadD [Inquilinus ginsengisoli]